MQTYELRKKRKRDKELRKNNDRLVSGPMTSTFTRKLREADEEKHMDEREEGEINENPAVAP